MFPAGKPAQSGAKQPVTGFGLYTAPCDIPRTRVAHDDVGEVNDRPGSGLLQEARAEDLEPDEIERLSGHGVAGVFQDLDRVVDRLVIAVRPGGTGPVVVVGDLLERGLMLANAFDASCIRGAS